MFSKDLFLCLWEKSFCFCGWMLRKLFFHFHISMFVMPDLPGFIRSLFFYLKKERKEKKEKGRRRRRRRAEGKEGRGEEEGRV